MAPASEISVMAYLTFGGDKTETRSDFQIAMHKSQPSMTLVVLI